MWKKKRQNIFLVIIDGILKNIHTRKSFSSVKIDEAKIKVVYKLK